MGTTSVIAVSVEYASAADKVTAACRYASYAMEDAKGIKSHWIDGAIREAEEAQAKLAEIKSQIEAYRNQRSEVESET